MGNIITNFGEFINEEVSNLPTTYKYSGSNSQSEDKKHDRLASKKKDGHEWKKNTKKHGEKSISQMFTCKCGYKKSVKNDENKDILITYSK